jgi:L-fuconolactonase
MNAVDSHLHVWDLAAADYPWLGPELAPIDRTVTFDEIAPALLDRGIDSAILVQAADNAADTEHMLAVADARPAVAGVVVWIPLHDPQAAAVELARLRRDPRVVGVRTLIHDRSDPDWILRPEVDAGLGVVEDAGVPYDFVTSGPAALRHLPVIAERHPDLVLVLDHLGKPPMDRNDPTFDRWMRLLRRAAENPRLSAKVSGLYGSDAAVADVVDVALETFGPNRLMFGSDWPMSELAGGLPRTWDALTSALSRLTPGERSAIQGGTARRVYGLPTTPKEVA